jgi:hypothetical protein
MVSIKTDFDVKNLENISWNLFLKGHFIWYSQYGLPSK